MSIFKVNYGNYSLTHSDYEKLLNYFEFNGKKYPLGTPIKFTKEGTYKMVNNGSYGYNKSGFRLADHFFDCRGKECWTYIIGWDGKRPIFQQTYVKPEVYISEVLYSNIDNILNENTFVPGKLELEFKEPNYSPKDSEVSGVGVGWIVFVLVWIGAFLFKDWWIVLIIQIIAIWSFGFWRENKINEAISKQEFKEW